MSTPIRLLSGLAGTAAAWRPTVELFGDDELEIPETPWARPGLMSSASETTAFLTNVCRDAGLVVAHSYAATLLLEHLTRTAPELQPPAVLLVSVFYRPRREDFTWKGISRFLNDFDTVLATGIAASATRGLSLRRSIEMARIVRDRIGPYGWMEFYGAYLRTPEFDLSRVESRLALVHGDRDAVSAVGDSRALTKASGAKFYELPGIGHFPMTEAPGELALAIRDIRTTTSSALSVKDSL